MIQIFFIGQITLQQQLMLPRFAHSLCGRQFAKPTSCHISFNPPQAQRKPKEFINPDLKIKELKWRGAKWPPQLGLGQSQGVSPLLQTTRLIYLPVHRAARPPFNSDATACESPWISEAWQRARPLPLFLEHMFAWKFVNVYCQKMCYFPKFLIFALSGLFQRICVKTNGQRKEMCVHFS